MSVQLTKEKLAGTNVNQLDDRIKLVDAANNQPLYDDISGGELLIPKGYFIILKDEDAVDVRIGTGGPWDEAIVLVTSEAAEPEA